MSDNTPELPIEDESAMMARLYGPKKWEQMMKEAAPTMRYAESRTQDEMGDMQDGVYESPTGEYIKVDDLLAWIDSEIAMAEENMLLVKGVAGAIGAEYKLQGIIGTYKLIRDKYRKP